LLADLAIDKTYRASEMRHAIHTAFKSAAERVLPVRSESGFKTQGVRFVILNDYCVYSNAVPRIVELGHAYKAGLVCQQVLTPDEFVRSGDYLVRTCSTWSWFVPYHCLLQGSSVEVLQFAPLLWWSMTLDDGDNDYNNLTSALQGSR
jgi:hypothetical protein